MPNLLLAVNGMADDARRFVHGRFPTDRKIENPEEMDAWAKEMVSRAREVRLSHDNEGDGYVYFLFQDHPKSGLVDQRPIYGRVPMQVILNLVAQRAMIGAQTKLVPVGKKPDVKVVQ